MAMLINLFRQPARSLCRHLVLARVLARVRPLADFSTPDSDPELLQELAGYIMISQHDIPQEIIEEWLKSMKEEEAWNEYFGENGSRLSSGKVESFHSLVTDQESPIRLEPAAKLKDTLTANGGVVMESWATGYNPDPATACKMKKHPDKHAQHFIRSVLTMGDSLAKPCPRLKTITFFKQVYNPNTGHYEESKSVTFKLPHGTLISMDAQGSGADSEMQREAKQPYFMHQVDDGCGTYALFFQFRRSCTEAKEVNIQELRGVFHSALPPVDPQKSELVHITSDHFVIPPGAAKRKAYNDNSPTRVRYSGTLKALNDGFNKACFEEGCTKDRWDRFQRCMKHQKALGCVEEGCNKKRHKHYPRCEKCNDEYKPKNRADKAKNRADKAKKAKSCVVPASFIFIAPFFHL